MGRAQSHHLIDPCFLSWIRSRRPAGKVEREHDSNLRVKLHTDSLLILEHKSLLVLVNPGPNLGAINRAFAAAKSQVPPYSGTARLRVSGRLVVR